MERLKKEKGIKVIGLNIEDKVRQQKDMVRLSWQTR